MNVAYITMLFPASTETFACSDIRELKNKGIELSVHSLRFAVRDTRKMASDRNVDGIPYTHNSVLASFQGFLMLVFHPIMALRTLQFIIFPNLKSFGFIFKSLVLLPRVFEIFFNLKRDRPDIVHLFWGHYPCMVGYLVQNYCPNIRLSMFLGAYDLIWNYGGTPIVAQKADVVWTHCKANIAKIRELGVTVEKIKLAYRGVDLGTINKKLVQRHRYRIISVGALQKSKKMDMVIRVFKKVKAKHDQASLVILGDGVERNYLEALCKKLDLDNSVEFLGHVSHEVVFREFSSSEVLIFLSSKESERLPNVVKEAMANGCICVVSETVGIDELVINRINGFVVSDANEDEICDIVCRVLVDEREKKKMMFKALEHINTSFDVKHTMEIYRKEWSKL